MHLSGIHVIYIISGVMRHLLLNNSNPRELISWYYSNPSRSMVQEVNEEVVDSSQAADGADTSSGEDNFNKKDTTAADESKSQESGENGNNKKSYGVRKSVRSGYSAKVLVGIANRLFMQSIYLPPILHYGKIFGE